MAVESEEQVTKREESGLIATEFMEEVWSVRVNSF